MHVKETSYVTTYGFKPQREKYSTRCKHINHTTRRDTNTEHNPKQQQVMTPLNKYLNMETFFNKEPKKYIY